MFSQLVLLSIIINYCSTEYAGNNALNSAGNSYGYGFSGSFGSNGGSNQVPQIDFNSVFNNYFDSFRKFHEQFINRNIYYSYAVTSSNPNANVQAHSSIVFNNGNGLQANSQMFGNALTNLQTGPGIGVPNINYKDNQYPGVGGGAISVGSISPTGGYQKAAVYPENPNSPNIETRFGEVSGSGIPGQGNYGVFTSSVSSSTNVDGKPKNFHQATTTVNDNGKISTYTVRNP